MIYSPCLHHQARAWSPRLLPCPDPNCTEGVPGEGLIVPYIDARGHRRRREYQREFVAPDGFYRWKRVVRHRAPAIVDSRQVDMFKGAEA